MLITNTFSLQMLDLNYNNLINITPITLKELQEKKDCLVSAIGDEDVAAVLSNLIGKTFLTRRVSIKLENSQPIIVANLIKGEIPKGATTLPENTQFKFVMVVKTDIGMD